MMIISSKTSTIVLVYGSLSIQMPPQMGIDSRSQRMWLRKIHNCVRSSKSAVNIILLSADDVFALIVGSSSVSEVASSCQ